MTDLYFDPNYAKLYSDIDGRAETFTFECEYGSMISTFLLRPTPISINGERCYDITTPYGYGGPLILNTTDREKLLEAYSEAFSVYCRERHIVCEFVRFHLFDNVDVREKYYGTTKHVLDNVVVDTTGNYEDIRMRYEHKVRKNVNKALTNGLTLLVENSTEHLDDFLNIYYATMDRNNATDYYYFKRDYFENIATLLPKNFMYFHVVKDSEIIATELVLCSEKYAYSFLGGTNRDFYAMRPNDFLKDGIIRWCNETGREKFILGGGYHKDDGIYKYKRSFTHDPDVPFYIGMTIHDQSTYLALVDERREADADFDDKSSYFPLYRA